MNRIAKLLLIGAMLLTLPMRYFAQNSRTVYNQETIEFDITDIDLFDERVFFIYNLVNDSRFDVKASEENGIFLINANEAFEGMNLEDSFLDFCHQNNAAFRQMDKAVAADVACEYKAFIPSEMFASLMMDYYVRSRQNNTCANADPFCTDNGQYQFPAGVNAGSGEAGPSYNCLSTTPNPAWYYMRIATPGNINIYMYSTPSHDIDFCCWGPFADPVSPCPNGLTADKVVSCSYSAAATENCIIPSSAQTGEYYILVITNYSNQTCNITFSKTGGTGTTDCGIMPPLVDNDGPYCVGETIHLTANSNGQSGATFSWTGPGGFTSTQQNPTRTNCTMAMSGTYTCTITVGSQTNNATTVVVVNPQPTANFNFTSVCKGTPTQFTNTSTNNPSGQPMTYQWNFGDGGTSTEQNPSHTYAQAGNYTVQLTVRNPNGTCSSQKTQTVPVYAAPQASASANPAVVMYGGSSQLSASAGVGGQFNFQWQPADKVVNPNSQNTTTVGLQETTTFTVTVTNPQGGCSSTAQVTVSIEGSGMTATASATPAVLCEGETTTLHANPTGGTGDYTFLWSPANTLSNPNDQNPTATPPVGTTHYTCQVDDGYTIQNVSVDVIVNPNTESHPVISICPDDTYNFFGQDINEPGPYEHTTTNHFGCDSTVYLTLQHYETYETSDVQTICDGETYNFYGQPLTTAGQYSHSLETVHGCDSIIKLTLRVNPVYEYDIDRSFCAGSYYPFNGQNITEPGDYTYNGQSVLGCDSIVHLHLSLTAYNSKVYDIERCNQPYTWPSTGEYFDEVGDYFRVDTVPGPTCDSIVTLNLSIHQDYPNVSFNTTDCDTHTWDNVGGRPYIENGQTYYIGREYSHSGNYTRKYQSIYGCDSIVTMHLTINESIAPDPVFVEDCDFHNWAEAGILFELSGTQSHMFQTELGCDSLASMTVDLEYTPHPSDSIMSPDANIGVATHSVITASEFQINTYDFTISEQGISHWENVEWTLTDQNGNDVNWLIEKEGIGELMHLTVFNYIPGRLILTATASNKCGSVSRTHWIECTFYGIEEESSRVNVDIVPNPNNGQMTLNFEYLTGNVNIKVYDMKGNRIDNFNIYNSFGPNTLQYSMKDFSDGMYYFVISGKEGSVTKKVIINK